MRNPFKLPESAEKYLTVSDHIGMNKRINKFIDILTGVTLASLAGIIIMGSVRYSDLKQIELLKGKLKQDGIHEQYIKQEQELLKDSV